MNFTIKNTFCSLDLETINGKYPTIYSCGMSFFAKSFKNAFNENIRNSIKNNVKMKIITENVIKNKRLAYLGSVDFDTLFFYLLQTNQDLKIITQNGAKFDLRFIIYRVLNKNLYKYKFDTSFLNSDEKKGIIVAYNNKVDDYDFLVDYLIDENKKVYFIKIVTKNNKELLFYDFNLMVAGSLAKKGVEIGFKKLINENDYKNNQLFNTYQELENCENEHEYLKRDCDITLLYAYQFYTLFFETFGGRCIGLTSSKTGFKVWKQLNTKLWIKDLIDKGALIEKKGQFDYYYEIKNKNLFNLKVGFNYKNNKVKQKVLENFYYNHYFPTYWIEKFDNFKILKNNYFGGYVVLNDKYSIQVKNENNQNKLISIDINGMYPFVMFSNKKAPYGNPIENITKLDNNYFQFFYVIPKKDLTTTHAPIFFNNDNGLRSWIRLIKKDVKYFGDTNTLNTIKKAYCDNNFDELFDLEIIFSFKWKYFNFFFKDYINYFYKLKKEGRANNNEIQASSGKLFSVVLYGVFGTNLDKVGLIYDEIDNNYVKFRSTLKGYYLPLAMAITSCARDYIQNKIGFNYLKSFVYCDTDSIHFVSNLKNYLSDIKDKYQLNLNKLNLGDVKLEFIGDYWIFRRAKQYFLFNNEEVKVATNGINWENELKGVNKNRKYLKYNEYEFFTKYLNFENLIKGFDLKYQVDTNHVVGYGVSIDLVKASLRPIWNYPPYTEQIKKSKKDYQKYLK